MSRLFLAVGAAFVVVFSGRALAEMPASKFVVDPPALTLSGPNSKLSLLIHGRTANGMIFDAACSAKFQSADPKIATVSKSGLVRGMSDGGTVIRVEVQGKTLTVPVQVVDANKPRRFQFENDIVPLLGRYGCNSSGCHGKAEGQNGFKLSVFGFDPAADYSALLKEGRGRRIFPAVPDKSLLLTKASGQVAHGGGNRIPVNSEAFETIRSWIAAGAPFGVADAPRVESIRVEPSERVMLMRVGQQLRIMARYTDGRDVDVTTQARFQSNNETVAAVSSDGLVTTFDVPGEAAIMAAFLNEVASFRLLVARAGKVVVAKLPINNFIDPLVDAKLKKLNVGASEPVDDSTFIRRVFLDIIGTLPTPDETRAFLSDKRTDKRAKLVDALLERPEYADYWALKWSDILRVDRSTLGHKRAYSYYRWIRDAFAENKPFDRFTRELITAEGLLDETPAANFYRVVSKPGEAASTVSQVFLGIRIACAECHHHPFDRWGQDDYYKMSAFFTPIVQKKIGTAEALVTAGDSTARNPRSGETLGALPLGVPGPKTPHPALPPKRGEGIEAESKGDQRERLADWMTAQANPFFARNLANRYWAHFLGRGIVEPVDDVRATNPPSNPELLDALAQSITESKYEVKKLIRTITASRVYQTSSEPTATNDRDEQNYSRALFRRIDAEVFLDMICQTTGVPEKFESIPEGTRAIQLWDSKVRHYFLKQFGRPVRSTPCECERNGEPNIAQILHMLNSETIDNKIRHAGGTAARLLRKFDDDGKLLDEMYLIFYSRSPSEKEKQIALDYLRKNPAKREQAVQDIMWAIMNTKEFMFNH